MTYVIPPAYVSILAVFGLVLCLFSFRKVEKMTRSSLLVMFKLGIIHIASSLSLIGALYFYYSIWDIDINTRSAFLRLSLSYILLSLDLGQIFLIRFGKNL